MAGIRYIFATAAAMTLCCGAILPADVRGATHKTGRIVMHDVQLFSFDDAPVRVVYLDGGLRALNGGTVDLNNVDGYGIDMRSAVVLIPPQTMSIVLNRYVLPRAQSPISDLHTEFGNGVIHMRGKIRAMGMHLGFTSDATPYVTADGKLGMRISHLKTAGFLPGGITNALGMGLEKMARPGKPGVMTVTHDSMIVAVSQTFPAPALSGKLTGVKVTPQGLVTRIGPGGGAKGAPFIRIAGGPIRFAHLTMPDANLFIKPRDKRADFGFSPRHYYQQMVAGYSRATPDFGLIGWFGDYRDVHPAAKR